MDKQKQMFEEFCKDTFMDGDSKGSKTISRANYKEENIIRLNGQERREYERLHSYTFNTFT